MLRRSMTLMVSLMLLAAGCSSNSDASEITFEHVFDRPTETSVWTATGEAIDNELLCSQATGVIQGFEDENGAVRRVPEEIEALYEAGQPFVNVSVELMTCDDGSGVFTLRLSNEIDPAIAEGVPVVESTWSVTGGSGYDDIEGGGDNELPQEQGGTVTEIGTGTITKQ